MIACVALPTGFVWSLFFIYIILVLGPVTISVSIIQRERQRERKKKTRYWLLSGLNESHGLYKLSDIVISNNTQIMLKPFVYLQ